MGVQGFGFGVLGALGFGLRGLWGSVFWVLGAAGLSRGIMHCTGY